MMTDEHFQTHEHLVRSNIKVKKLSHENKKLKAHLNELVEVAHLFNDKHNEICEILLKLPSIVDDGRIVESNYD